MASVASQLIEEVTAHAQSDSLEDARGICADGTYFPNNMDILTIFIVGLLLEYKLLTVFNYCGLCSDENRTWMCRI